MFTTCACSTRKDAHLYPKMNYKFLLAWKKLSCWDFRYYSLRSNCCSKTSNLVPTPSSMSSCVYTFVFLLVLALIHLCRTYSHTWRLDFLLLCSLNPSPIFHFSNTIFLSAGRLSKGNFGCYLRDYRTRLEYTPFYGG